LLIEWIHVKDRLPDSVGEYHVLRQWSTEIIAAGSAYFDGLFWQPKLLDDAAGPVTHWLPIEDYEEKTEFIVSGFKSGLLSEDSSAFLA
jgi:hypothetical protein